MSAHIQKCPRIPKIQQIFSQCVTIPNQKELQHFAIPEQKLLQHFAIPEQKEMQHFAIPEKKNNNVNLVFLLHTKTILL